MGYPLTMPSSPAPSVTAPSAETVTAASISPFTLRGPVMAWPGQRWRFVVTVPQMDRVKAAAWHSFFSALRGREGTFIFGDSTAFTRAESPHSADWSTGQPTNVVPVTVGTTQGDTVTTNGWVPNVQFAVRNGQWLEIAGRLHRSLSDVHSSSTGEAVLRVWPSLNAVPPQTEIIWREPKGLFRLDQEPPELVQRVDLYLSEFTFTIVEA